MNGILVGLLTLCVSVHALQLAKPCDVTKCKLPSCKCSTTDSSSGIAIENIPQIVMLTFDDAVTAMSYEYFERVLFGLKNPDGCPIGVTHFASHEYTDYTKVHDLWKRGHEIALHSVTHSTMQDYWKNIDTRTLIAEFGDMREIVSHFAAIPKDDIRGIRLPFLQLAGNRSFVALEQLGLTYDSSIPTQQNDPALWPYTFEYQSSQDCPIPPCPTASFPGIWEVPMVMWKDQLGVVCSMVDACTNVPQKAEPLSEWLIEQFNRHYKGSRAPFPVFMHAAWFFRDPEYFAAYKLFIDHLQSLPDVYLVTVNQAIEWIKNQKPLSADKPLGECQVRQPTRDCTPKTCPLKNLEGNERWMTSCAESCPIAYPWIGNPFGNA